MKAPGLNIICENGSAMIQPQRRVLAELTMLKLAITGAAWAQLLMLG